MANTGFKHWVLFQIRLVAQPGRVTAKDNPLWDEKQYVDIRTRARIDTFSEQFSVVIIMVAILGGYNAKLLGASGVTCAWFPLTNTGSVLLRFVIVVGIRFLTFVFEEFVVRRLGARFPALPAVVIRRDWVWLAGVLCLGTTFQVLSVTD